MGKDVIIACDFPSEAACLGFLERLESHRPFVKIGMELFYAEGPGIVRKLKARGHKVFLDLKLHDIPHTVRGAMAALRDLGADMVNLHAAGGIAMMEAAREGLLRPDHTGPLLIAVTQLTSVSEEQMRRELLIPLSLEAVVRAYAQNAKSAGLDGVVCSPLEAELVHTAVGKNFLTVTPGVRFEDGDAEDQARVTTPAKARERGSDYIVVGRPVTKAKEPAEAYERCVRDFVG